MTYLYKHAILGGTFDHFHAGHEKLILSALIEAKHITVGLVKIPLTSEKDYPDSIESYAQREVSLTDFFKKHQVISRVNIIPLHDIYGTSLTDPIIEAIFVTDSTLAGAKQINDERIRIGLQQLVIVVVPLMLSDDGDIISSSRIRMGLIDRQGHSYLKYLEQKPNYRLPDNLRENLQNPLGRVITNPQDLYSIITHSDTLIAVGDIVSTDLLQAGYHPAVCIIDHRTRRTDLDPQLVAKFFPLAHHKLINPAGFINSQIGKVFLTSLEKNQTTSLTHVIAIEGEEDLLTLPALLLAPLNSYVIYGQFNVGMCVVQVTESIKTLAKSYLGQFT